MMTRYQIPSNKSNLYSESELFKDLDSWVEPELKIMEPYDVTSSSTNNIPYEEWTTLQSFYHSTNGQYWRYKKSRSNSTHWNFTHYPTNNPCYDQWAGVVCTCNHYTRDHYYSYGTYGYVYSYDHTNPLLMSQCNVQKLVLVQYNLSGTITSKIGNFRNLTILIIPRNNLIGTIPEELAFLVNIMKLGLADNKLTGTIPACLGNLNQIVDLCLNNNFLTGTIPRSLGNLNLLQQLNLYSNTLTGIIPSTLGNLNELQNLDLHINSLTGSIPSTLEKLQQLQLLDVNSNSLTGTISSSLGNLKNIKLFYVYLNSLTGTIPSSFGNFTKIEYVYLNSNFLTGTIPSPSSVNSYKLRYFDVASNSLSGTIPSLMSNLQSLIGLFLFSNILSGPITNIFSSKFQVNLSIIQLNHNQLTGNLDGEMFNLPNLKTVDVAINCFSINIPYSTICQGKRMQSLIFDGLHTASSCRQPIVSGTSLFSSAYTLNSNLFSRIDPCVFTMTSLTTLHLSGNGLTGSLPSNISISPSLTDLALSHNLLTGTLPDSFQLKKWNSLDLSFNRITGTLSSKFANLNVSSSLLLQQNRFSGFFPSSALNIKNVDVLNGNLFDCDFTKSNIPQYDSQISNYDCGSNIFNISYYIWLGLTVFIILVMVALLRFLKTRRLKLIFGNLLNMIPSVKPSDSSTIKSEIPIVRDKVFNLMRISFYVTMYIITVLLTIYIVNGFFFGIYTYQYAWSVAIAFLSGSIAFGLTLSALLVLILLFLLLSMNNKLSHNNIVNVTGEKNIYSLVCNGNFIPSSISSLTWTITPLMNVAVVGGVNALYVVSYLTLSTNVVVVLQIFLAMFKSFWNGIGYRHLRRVINSHYNIDNLSIGHYSLQLLIRLLNNIAIPCVVVAVINPDCFYNLVAAQPTVKSSFKYKVCELINKNGDCFKYIYPTHTTTFDPPFLYSYQCSSRFITYYAPAFVFLCLIDGIFLPLAQLVSVIIYKHGLKNNHKWTILMKTVMPRILRIDIINGSIKKAKRDDIHPFFDSLQLILNNFTYLALIMTFGAVFPPLAASFFVTVCLMNCWFFWKVDRFVDYAKKKNRLEFVNVVEEECEGCLSSDKVVRSVWMIITMSCFFYSLFLFDTLGDAVGVAGAYWVLVVMPLVPLIDYFFYNVCLILWRRWIKDKKNNNDSIKNGFNNSNNNKTDNDSNSDIEIELVVIEN